MGDKFLSIPAPKYLALDINHYQKKLKEEEQKKNPKVDITGPLYALITEKKDYYRLGTASNFDAPKQVVDRERDAIRILFKELKGFQWNRNFGWVGQTKTHMKPQINVFETEVELYEGISVKKLAVGKTSNNFLTSLSLQNNACDGKFPAGVTTFTYCKLLLLHWNAIGGQLPFNFRSLVNLRDLNLSGNCLEGSLDVRSFECLEKLITLNVSFNKFTGSIPDCFGSLPQLTDLNMSDNQFTGPIPKSISFLKKLTKLKLFRNELSGPIPASISTLQKLTEVNLSENKLTGPIDPLWCCTALRKLALNNNSLSGLISGDISNLQKLEVLHLHHNFLYGRVPDGLCALSAHLRMVNLSYNELHGSLPVNIGDLGSGNGGHLMVFRAHDNHLMGPVPRSVASLTQPHLHGHSLSHAFSQSHMSSTVSSHTVTSRPDSPTCPTVEVEGSSTVHSHFHGANQTQGGALIDFLLFDSFPSETFTRPRGFNRKEFDRIHVVGPEFGLDSISWDHERLYGNVPPNGSVLNEEDDRYKRHCARMLLKAEEEAIRHQAQVKGSAAHQESVHEEGDGSGTEHITERGDDATIVSVDRLGSVMSLCSRHSENRTRAML